MSKYMYRNIHKKILRGGLRGDLGGARLRERLHTQNLEKQHILLFNIFFLWDIELITQMSYSLFYP